MTDDELKEFEIFNEYVERRLAFLETLVQRAREGVDLGDYSRIKDNLRYCSQKALDLEADIDRTVETVFDFDKETMSQHRRYRMKRS